MYGNEFPIVMTVGTQIRVFSAVPRNFLQGGMYYVVVEWKLNLNKEIIVQSGTNFNINRKMVLKRHFSKYNYTGDTTKSYRSLLLLVGTQ